MNAFGLDSKTQQLSTTYICGSKYYLFIINNL